MTGIGFTKIRNDFPHVTLAQEDYKWVEAQKVILADSSCLCLAENNKQKSAPTGLSERDSEQDCDHNHKIVIVIVIDCEGV